MRLTFLAPAAIAATMTLLVSGCGKPAADTGGTQPELPAGDALVLRVEYADGFVPVEYSVTRLPVLSVYADGRVLSEGAQIAIYPGPALPNIEERVISKADVAKLAGLAITAGVGKELDFGQLPIADAPDTKFTVHTAEGTRTTRVNALTMSVENGLTGAQQGNRQKMRDLFAALTDLPKTLGAGAVGASQPYQPTAIAAVASTYTAPAEIPAPPSVKWPAADLPGAPVGNLPSIFCSTSTGDQAKAVLQAAAGANTATGWTSAGQTWRLTFRPLLPGETGCANLTAM